MIVNCTKYDPCICGHERKDHKYPIGDCGKIIPNTKKKCLTCDCTEFVFRKD
jgi:hypothetical protein